MHYKNNYILRRIKNGRTYKKKLYNFVFLLIQLILLNQIYEEVEGLE